MHDRLVDIINRHGGKVEYATTERTVTVSGVGNGTNSTDLMATFPGAVRDASGVIREISFTSPIIPNSEIPALWGNDSLNRNRAIVDTVNRELVLCSPGSVRIVAPAGTWRLPMTLTPSGHWLVPMTCFEELVKQQLDPKNQQQKVASFPSTSSSSSASGIAVASAAETRTRGVTFNPDIEQKEFDINLSEQGTQTQGVQTVSPNPEPKAPDILDTKVYNLEEADIPTDVEDVESEPRKATLATQD